MLDKIEGMAAAAAAVPDARIASVGSSPFGPAAGASEGLPSVGRGSQLAWAQTWSDLSTNMRSVGVNVESVAQRSAAAQEPGEVMASMGEMLRASRHLTESSVQFQLVTGVVTNAASAVNKLLTQQ